MELLRRTVKSTFSALKGGFSLQFGIVGEVGSKYTDGNGKVSSHVRETYKSYDDYASAVAHNIREKMQEQHLVS